MKSSIKRLDEEITLEYQRVVLLAGLLNEYRHVNQEEGLASTHLLTQAFMYALDRPFVACEGEVINLTRDMTSRDGVVVDVRFKETRSVIGGRASLVPHSWLYLPDQDVIIDVLPPGSDPRYVTPVKYLPNTFRPAYTKRVLETPLKPLHSEVVSLAKLLQSLEKKGMPIF